MLQRNGSKAPVVLLTSAGFSEVADGAKQPFAHVAQRSLTRAQRCGKRTSIQKTPQEAPNHIAPDQRCDGVCTASLALQMYVCSVLKRNTGHTSQASTQSTLSGGFEHHIVRVCSANIVARLASHSQQDSSSRSFPCPLLRWD
jgi:hypothetical protein